MPVGDTTWSDEVLYDSSTLDDRGLKDAFPVPWHWPLLGPAIHGRGSGQDMCNRCQKVDLICRLPISP
jgi:hypothetical protein